MINLRSIYPKIDWDLTSNRVSGTLGGKQNDTGRGMEVNLIQGGTYITPIAAEVLRLRYSKPDGTSGYVSSTIVNGKYLIENLNQVFTITGEILCDFELTVDGEFIKSADFIIISQESQMNNEIESSNDFSVLQEFILKFDGVMNQEDIRLASEINRVASETSRVTAEGLRVANETSRGTAEGTRVTNETSRVTAETARVTADTARTTAEGTRVANETARGSAETSRATAESSRVTAETDRTTAEGLRVTNTANAINSMNTAVTNTTIIWKSPVATYSNIATTYPSPAVGWRVEVLDTKAIYRYNGSAWVYISDNTVIGAELLVNKGAPSGYAPLDASSKVPVVNLPAMDYAPSSHVHTIANTTGLQTALDGKLPNSGFTPSVVMVTNSSGTPTVDSTISTTELGYLNGVTSAIQTQFTGKANSIHTHTIADTTGLQTALDNAGTPITGGATTIATTNLAVSKALVSDASGKVAVSAVTSTELGYVSGVTSSIQTQIAGKQATITGGATTIDTENLTASRALVSDASGKVAVSAVTSTELGYVDGVTSAIQTQINSKANQTDVDLINSSMYKPSNDYGVYSDSENSIEILFSVNTTNYENIYAVQPLKMIISSNGVVRITGKVRVKTKGTNPVIATMQEPKYMLDSVAYQTSPFEILRETVVNTDENHIIRFTPINYWNPEVPAIYRTAMISLRKIGTTYGLEFHSNDYDKMLVNAEVYIDASSYWRYFDKGYNYKQIVSKTRLLSNTNFNFIFAPDIHAAVRDSRHAEGIALINRCKNIFPMPVISIGDIVNNYDKAEVVNGINGIVDKLGSNVLFAKGNHDDNSLKSRSVNDVITEPELRTLLFDKMHPVGLDVTFSSDGLYYYADDPVRKIRIVVLNTHENDYTVTSGNIAEQTAGKGYINQKQIEFVANYALDLKVQKGGDYTNWHTVFMAHYPLNFAGTKGYGGETCENGTEMWEVIKAFKSGLSVTIPSTARTNPVHSLTGLTKSFVSQGAMNVVGFFYGHYHNDQTQVKDGVTFVTSECFSSVNYTVSWEQTRRAVFSYDEFIFDIVTINKATKTVTLKRIGNDSVADRSFTY